MASTAESIVYSTQRPADIPDERLLAAAKQDNDELLKSALAQLKDVNYVDGWVWC